MQRRILVIGQSLGIGGIEASLIRFLEYLSTRNCAVDLVLFKESGAFLQDIPDNVTVTSARVPEWVETLMRLKDELNPLPIETLLRHSGVPRRSVRILEYVLYRTLNAIVGRNSVARYIPRHRGRFDVAVSYFHYGFAPRYLVSRVSAESKYMWYHHGDYNQRGANRRSDRRTFKRMDAIVAVSETAKEALLMHFPSLAGRIRVIGNPFDASRIVAAASGELDVSVPTGKLIIATVSRLSHEKGVDVAIRTAALLKEKAVKFLWYIVGDGREQQNLRSLVEELNLEKECILLGARTNPFPIVNAADILVQTSRVEADPLTIREAMALGKPIVATDLPPIVDLLKEGHLGMTCRLDESDFAEAIIKMLNPETRDLFASRLRNEPMSNGIVRDRLDELLGLSTFQEHSQ